MKTFKICPDPECSPAAPMTGTILKRKYVDDPMTYRCAYCKNDYDADVLGSNICPRCQRPMKHTKIWWLECPRCGKRY